MAVFVVVGDKDSGRISASRFNSIRSFLSKYGKPSSVNFHRGYWSLTLLCLRGGSLWSHGPATQNGIYNAKLSLKLLPHHVPVNWVSFLMWLCCFQTIHVCLRNPGSAVLQGKGNGKLTKNMQHGARPGG